MRAVLPAPGDDAVVRVADDVSDPEPEPGEVLVRVSAAGMNRADLLHARGRYAQRAFADSGRPDVCGMEMAGHVTAIGAEAAGVEVGEPVMGLCAGAYAERVAVDPRFLMPVPDGLALDEAATLPMALLTAFEALERLAALRPGESVLVTGATSATGLAAVQVAALLGAGTLYATTRAPEHHDLLRSLGADHVGPALPADADVDIVVDHVGGDLLEATLPRLARGGRVISVGRLGGRTASVDLTALAGRRGQIIGTTWKTQTADDVAISVAAARERLLPALSAGRVRPVVGRTWALDDAVAAYADLDAARAPGKPVIVVAG